MSPHLLPHHAKMLEESAISAEVIAARGYRSIEKKSELEKLGFSGVQCIVPTLVIPIWNVLGEIAMYHHRPDHPRCDSEQEKEIKYEFPANSKMVIDIHPFLTKKIHMSTQAAQEKAFTTVDSLARFTLLTVLGSDQCHGIFLRSWRK